MWRGWIKRILPRGLYGRAALILVLPIVMLQLVVSVLFIQRHYEGVAEQMTRNAVVSLRYLLREIDAAPDLPDAQARVAALLGPLALREWALPPPAGAAPPEGDLRNIDDLTGRAVIATLRNELDGVIAVDLASVRREARIWLDTAQGPMLVALERRRVSASNPHQLLVIVVFTGVLMMVIAYLFMRNQLRPIKELAEAAEAFGKGRSEPYRVRGATEVRSAGRAFLAMRDRIERQIEQRTHMLSAVSHDLRTPLTRMKLGLAMLDEGPEARALEGDVAEMEALVQSFLDFVRGSAIDAPAPTDAVALVRQAVENARRAGLAVELGAVVGEGQEAPLRPQIVARALDNLIANAVRYGRRCRVGVAVGAETVRLAVEDDGPGIPPERRDEALQPFVRLDAARNQDSGAGVGLGLAIVADAVRQHGGSLTLGASGALGGLKVEIVLPR